MKRTSVLTTIPCKRSFIKQSRITKPKSEELNANTHLKRKKTYPMSLNLLLQTDFNRSYIYLKILTTVLEKISFVALVFIGKR